MGLLAIVAVALSLFTIGGQAAQRSNDDLEIPEDAEPARYIENIDGDTIVVEIEDVRGDFWEYDVRLIGIDTPENSYSYGNEPECYGREATNKTDSLLVTAEDGIVWLEADERDEDPYGRLLRYVWYVSEIDGEVHFLNEDLVREGYALSIAYRPNFARQDELDDAEESAIRGGRGMWLTCDASVSMDPDLEEDGEPDDVPIDRTKTPVEDDEEAVCSLFEYWDEAQDFMDEYPEIAEELDPDGNGIACDKYFGIDG